MKKLNLEKLKLIADDVLQRDQMTTIYGGSDSCPRYSCRCTGSVGSWEGTYCSPQDVAAAIIYWCASSAGVCNAQ